MLFNFKSPKKEGGYVLKLHIFDKDVLSGNDFICEFDLDLSLIVEDTRLTQRPMHLTKTYYK
jgi:hypothetical protein